MSETKTAINRIGQGVEILIKKHGIEKSANLIEALTLNEGKSKNFQAYYTLKTFIEKQVIDAFKISHQKLCISASNEYKNARKCLFYFLNTQCSMSSGIIKKQYPKYTKTRNNISAIIKEVKDVIETPKANKDLFEKITIIKTNIQNFKTDL